jgi:hypothetical protein
MGQKEDLDNVTSALAALERTASDPNTPASMKRELRSLIVLVLRDIMKAQASANLLSFPARLRIQ